MEDNIATSLIKFSFICITIIILSIVSCNIHQDYRIAKAITEGSDPVRARLAFENVTNTGERTVAIMSEKKRDN